MNELGFKIALPGKDADDNINALDFVVHSRYPSLKCWARPEPKHYQLVKIRVNSLTNGTVKELVKFAHGYNFKPFFIPVWQCPQGTGLSANNQYGVGNYEYFSFDRNFIIRVKVDATNFSITLEDVAGSGTSALNLDISFRFYIFGDELSDTQNTNIAVEES